jgi:pimeloyl-ACP methyl ester carboxylesterase
MKSSSELFPVSLLKADCVGAITEDTYLIKHNLDPDHSVQIAISRLGRQDVNHSGLPLILVHGSFTNRGFWLSRSGQGLARFLLDEGFDVWLLEHRGHGLSPRNQDYVNNSVERYALYDLPAAQAFVAEQTGRTPAWIGHSLGGGMIATALAARALPQKPSGIVLIGSQMVMRPWYLWFPGVGFVLRRIVSFRQELDGRQLRIGPENEPAGVINEYLARQDWFGRWKAQAKDLLPLWRLSSTPLLGLSGVADTTDPAKYCQRFYRQYGGPKEDVLLSKANGFSEDYGHIDMVVSRPAEKDVWPLISRWLSAYA